MNTNLAPSSFVLHDYRISFTVKGKNRDVFEWLMRKDTFTSGQIPPYKVEFLQQTPSEFMQVGDQTNHHGPLIQFAGVISQVLPERYRKLDYYYGSYALSFRWARPACLEIFTSSEGTQGLQTEITLGLKTHVHKLFYPLWNVMMILFWNSFAANTKLLWLFKKE